jgi:hypothetical protein
MMKNRIKLCKFRDENGAALVLVALSMVVLLGFTALVIDGGRLYAEKSNLQKALDAAVLAGAHGLFVKENSGDLDQAIFIAKEVSRNNGYELSYEGDNPEIDIAEGSYIRAEKTVSVPMTFAKVLNIDRVPVKASAKAVVAPLEIASGIAPIAVEKSKINDAIEKIASGTYEGTDLLCSKEEDEEEDVDNSDNNGNNGNNGNGNQSNSGQHSPGNCGFLDLEGGSNQGANALSDFILKGGTFSIGNRFETTEPGGITQAKEAIDQLMTSDAAAGRGNCGHPNTADNSCDRVLNIPVIDTWTGTNGQDEVEVVGFASFWLESFSGTGNNKYLKGRLIKTVSPGEVGELTGDDAPSDGSLFGVKLVE